MEPEVTQPQDDKQEATQPEAAPAPQQEAPVAQEPVAPEPTPEDDDSDPIPSFNLPQPQAKESQPAQPQPQAQEIPALKPDDFADQYGNVDMAKFTQAMAERDRTLAEIVTQRVAAQVAETILPQAAQMSAQQAMAIRQEERLWAKAETKYPELKANKELRDLVHNTRMNYLEKGTQYSPAQAADRLFKYIRQAESVGAEQATQTVRVQASAHLESADNTASESQVRTRDLQNRISSHNKSEARVARESLLKEWMSDGKIQLPQ